MQDARQLLSLDFIYCFEMHGMCQRDTVILRYNGLNSRCKPEMFHFGALEGMLNILWHYFSA